MSGFTNEVVNANNVDFSGGSPVSAKLVSNGQMLIGSTALNAGGTHINVGNLVSTSSTLTIGYLSPNITMEVTGAASGKVLQGAGVGVPPVYSTATYPSIAGTSGNILTSDGTNWTSSAPTSTFSPNSNFQLYDDFISTSSAGSFAGLLNWVQASSAFSYSNSIATSAHPGVISNASTSTASNTYIMLGQSTFFSSQIYLGGGILVLNWVFNIGTLSNGTNRYSLFLGMANSATSSTPSNAVGFAYTDNANSGNWTYKCVSATTPTSSNSSTAVSTGWHNAQITVNANASSVSFIMDGVSLGTAITTNIPTVGMLPIFSFLPALGTIAADTLSIDLFYLNQTLTTPR